VSLFITFEGPDGSGKTTQLQLLAEYLQRQGHRVLCTREPGGTAIGDQIRHILHDVNNTDMTPLAEILLYSASRAQLVAQVIKPVLATGGIVLCDRYADSTYAYQGYGRGLDLAVLKMIAKFATQNVQPDLTIYLDLPAEAGLRRKQQANSAGQGEWNRMDQLTLDFHKRVRQGYLTMAQAEPSRWLVIDAEQSVSQIHQAVWRAVAKIGADKLTNYSDYNKDLEETYLGN
jgi:dTMP kinase